MVALYVIASHVLLLNLLIAQFNATFVKVKEEAEHHQAWQRCQLVEEYTRRSPLPPPCSILRTVITLIKLGCAGMCRVIPRCLLCTTPSTGAHNRRPGRFQCLYPAGPDDVTQPERMELLREESPRYPSCPPPELSSSVNGKCVTISSLYAMQYFTVELRDSNNVVQSAHSYSVRDGTKRVMLWREDPTHTVTINGAYLIHQNMEEEIEETDQVSTTFGANESIKTLQQTKLIDRWNLQKFDDEQAMFALSETDLLGNTQADTPAWATQPFGSIDHKIETAVKSALNTKVTPNTPAGSSQEASSSPTAPTPSAVKPSPASEDTPVWATRLFDSMDKMEAALRAQYRPSLVLTDQGRPPPELYQRPAVQ